MDAFPHHYRSGFSLAATDAAVTLTSPGLDPIATAAPAEFGGPGDCWSPETLLVGAIASCFALSFRSVADASKFSWRSLHCDVEGTLDREDRVTRFTSVRLSVVLEIDTEVNEERAERLLHKAEEICLVTNSLRAEVVFSAEVRTIS